MTSRRPKRDRKQSRAGIEASLTESYFSDSSPPHLNQSSSSSVAPLQDGCNQLPSSSSTFSVDNLPSLPPSKKQKLNHLKGSSKRLLSPPPPPQPTKKAKRSTDKPPTLTPKSTNVVKGRKKISKTSANENEGTYQQNAQALDKDKSIPLPDGDNKNDEKEKKARKPRAKKQVQLRPSSRYLPVDNNIGRPLFPSPTLSSTSPSSLPLPLSRSHVLLHARTPAMLHPANASTISQPFSPPFNPSPPLLSSLELRTCSALPQLHGPTAWSPSLTLLNGTSVEVPLYQIGGSTNIEIEFPPNLVVRTQTFVSNILHQLSAEDSGEPTTLLTFAINTSVEELTTLLSKLSTPATVPPPPPPPPPTLSTTALLDQMASDYPDSLFDIVPSSFNVPTTSNRFSHIYLLPLSFTRNVIKAKMERLYQRLFEFEDAPSSKYLLIAVLSS
ncbi:hypothetical protein JCM5353_001138 [Sporobolomyces roseus]